MIRVTVELIPYGYEEPEHIGELHIANNGPVVDFDADQIRYRYKARFGEDMPWAELRFTHDRRDGVWALVAATIDEMWGER